MMMVVMIMMMVMVMVGDDDGGDGGDDHDDCYGHRLLLEEYLLSIYVVQEREGKMAEWLIRF